MAKPLVGIPNSDEINNSDKHTLFVEGSNNTTFDVKILEELLKSEDLDEKLRVKPMGASFHVKSVAQALYEYHNNYYFLIDRDAQSDNEVEKSWKKFPDPNENNLLIWRKKEIENYFLDPNFICKSEFFNGNKNDFIKKLEEEATKRVFLDIANSVIVDIREKLKNTWVECFKYNESNFNSSDKALKSLLNLTNFKEKKDFDNKELKEANLKKIFKEKRKLFLENETTCKFGVGKWIDLMSGKKLLNVMINFKFFTLTDKNGNTLNYQGKDKVLEICKSLVKLDDVKLPTDFVELKNLIKTILEN